MPLNGFLTTRHLTKGFQLRKAATSSNKLLQSQIKLNKWENKENTLHKPSIPRADLVKLKSSDIMHVLVGLLLVLKFLSFLFLVSIYCNSNCNGIASKTPIGQIPDQTYIGNGGFYILTSSTSSRYGGIPQRSLSWPRSSGPWLQPPCTAIQYWRFCLCYAEAKEAANSIHVYDYQKFQKLFFGEI